MRGCMPEVIRLHKTQPCKYKGFLHNPYITVFVTLSNLCSLCVYTVYTVYCIHIYCIHTYTEASQTCSMSLYMYDKIYLRCLYLTFIRPPKSI